MNEDFNKLVEQFMLMDKKTLAELLALKELANRQDTPVTPSYPWPFNWPWPWPWHPGIGDTPWWPQIWYTSTSNGKEYENFSQAELNRQDVVENTKSNPDINVNNGFCGGYNYGGRNIC